MPLSESRKRFLPALNARGRSSFTKRSLRFTAFDVAWLIPIDVEIPVLLTEEAKPLPADRDTSL